MKFIECPQGTAEWFAARCGKITASCFADAISTVGGLTEQQEQYVTAVLAGATEKDAAASAGYKTVPSSDIVRRALAGERTEDWSDTAKRYAADLAIERISGQPHGEPPKAWVLERGHEMEAHARRIYEGRTGAFVTEAGICLTDDGTFGYSSDGLVDDDGLIEIKAPIDSIKIMHVLKTGDTSEYDHQMQGGLWITGRKWCDFIMYVPDLACVGKDLYIKRVFRDDAFIDAMLGRLAEFDKMVEANVAILTGPRDPEELVDADFVEVAAQAQNEQQNIPEIIPGAVAPFDASTTSDSAASIAERPLGQLVPAKSWPHSDERPAVPAAVATAPTLRLGQMAERLRFTVTADFLRSLGFEPAARDKAAMLYQEADFDHICRALVRHISGVMQKQAA